MIETLRRDVKRLVDEANTELGADTDSLIKQRDLLNDVTVELSANAEEPDIPYVTASLETHALPRGTLCCSPTALSTPAGSFL